MTQTVKLILEDGTSIEGESFGAFTSAAGEVVFSTAMTGLPLPQPRQHSPAIMLNLLGDVWFDGNGQPHEPDWHTVLSLPGTHLHLYGKLQARVGRKMGHLTITGPDVASVKTVARRAAGLLGLPGLDVI